MKRHLAFLALFCLFAAIGLYMGYSIAPNPHTELVFFAPAITANGQGVMVPFHMKLRQGTGGVFVNVFETSFKEDVENSLRKARVNAENFMGVSLQNFDVVLEVPPEQKTVSGESAGAMFTIALISLFSGHSLRQGVAMSATIDKNGELHEVDGIEEKILAALAEGNTVFIVCPGQQIKDESTLKGLGVQIVRAKNIGDVAAQMLS